MSFLYNLIVDAKKEHLEKIQAEKGISAEEVESLEKFMVQTK